MPLKRMLIIAFGLAVLGLLALFVAAYFNGEDIRIGLSRTDGQLIAAGVFVGVLLGSLVSMKMLIKSSNMSKVLYLILVLGGLLLWYEYETAQITRYLQS